MYATSAAALVGGISILFAANAVLQSARSAPAITVDPASWGWASRTEISAQSLQNRPVFGPTIAVPAANVVEQAYQPLPQRKLAIRSLGRVFKKAPVAVAQNKTKIQVQDQLTTAQAATVPQLSEHEKMQNIQMLLRGRFVAAVLDVAPETLFAESKSAKTVSTQSAGTPVQAKKVNTQSAPEVARSLGEPVVQPKVAVAPKVEDFEDPTDINKIIAEISAAKSAQVNQRFLKKWAPAVHMKKFGKLERLLSQNDPLAMPNESPVAKATTHTAAAIAVEPNRVNSQQSPPQATSPNHDEQSPGAKSGTQSLAAVAAVPTPDHGNSPADRIVTTQAAPSFDTENAESEDQDVEYSEQMIRLGYPVTAAVLAAGPAPHAAAQPTTVANTTYNGAVTAPHARTPIQEEEAASQDHLKSKAGRKNGIGMMSLPEGPNQPGPEAAASLKTSAVPSAARTTAALNAKPSLVMMAAEAPVTTVGCVEGFQWYQEIPFCDRRVLTHEFSEGSWIMAQAKDHWPTLYWRGAKDLTTPLISNNAAILLGKLAETSVQAEAGIVFGTVPAGWTVTISGRADQPVFLNLKNEIIPGTALDSERHFAFLNVEPGANVLYFNRPASHETGSVAIPVVNGAATYIELDSISFKAVSGWVLDAATSKGVSQAAVTVVDQPVSARTDSRGAFQIEKIAIVGDMPVYVETRVADKDQYPHRYRLSPKQLSRVSLYRFKSQMVDGWVGQIEGGVSAESALVIGAIPQLAARGEGKKLLTSVRTVLETQMLQPETYVLSPAGEVRLQNQLSVSPSVSRILSVQVPGGPVIAGLKAENGEQIWSEMLLVSPRVISVVGPY